MLGNANMRPVARGKISAPLHYRARATGLRYTSTVVHRVGYTVKVGFYILFLLFSRVPRNESLRTDHEERYTRNESWSTKNDIR